MVVFEAWPVLQAGRICNQAGVPREGGAATLTKVHGDREVDVRKCEHVAGEVGAAVAEVPLEERRLRMRPRHALLEPFLHAWAQLGCTVPACIGSAWLGWTTIAGPPTLAGAEPLPDLRTTTAATA